MQLLVIDQKLLPLRLAELQHLLGQIQSFLGIFLYYLINLSNKAAHNPGLGHLGQLLSSISQFGQNRNQQILSSDLPKPEDHLPNKLLSLLSAERDSLQTPLNLLVLVSHYRKIKIL